MTRTLCPVTGLVSKRSLHHERGPSQQDLVPSDVSAASLRGRCLSAVEQPLVVRTEIPEGLERRNLKKGREVTLRRKQPSTPSVGRLPRRPAAARRARTGQDLPTRRGRGTGAPFSGCRSDQVDAGAALARGLRRTGPAGGCIAATGRRAARNRTGPDSGRTGGRARR